MSAPPPTLSVVVAASSEPGLLARCLHSLTPQPGVDEVVVASNYPVGGLGEAFPEVRFVGLPAGTTVPMLRTRGVQATRGDVVALSEDNVVFRPGWAAAIRSAHAGGHEVVGGPVERRAGSSAPDWAVYLYEYGRFMPPTPAGPTDRLPGNNVSYSRRVLDAVADEMGEGFFEAFLHEALRQRGVPLVMEPGAVVEHVKSYPVATALRQCYHHGRGYAGMRVEGASRLRRAAWGAASLGLPVLLPGRIAVQTLRKGRARNHLVRAFPYLVVFMAAWASGETAGYLAGPGESVQAWT